MTDTVLEVIDHNKNNSSFDADFGNANPKMYCKSDDSFSSMRVENNDDAKKKTAIEPK
jgi:hypothetical protein